MHITISTCIRTCEKREGELSDRFFHVPVEMCGDLFSERENLRRSERFSGGGESLRWCVWRVGKSPRKCRESDRP